MNNLLKRFFQPMLPSKLVSAQYVGDIMTCKYENGEEVKYIGECTVWHEYPMMQRCSSSMEKSLCDLWTYCKKWGGAYPDAHLKKDN